MVDLDASMVLKDLRKIREEEKVQHDMNLLPQSELASAHHRGLGVSLEDSLRQSLEPARASIEKPFKQDALTVKMFESRGVTGDRYVHFLIVFFN